MLDCDFYDLYKAHTLETVDDCERIASVMIEHESMSVACKKTLVNLIFQKKRVLQNLDVDPFKFLLKYLVHKIYRLLFKVSRKKKAQIVQKSWVKLNYELFNDISDRHVLVLPFGINIHRQLAYITFLKKEGVSYSYYGYNYCFADVITIFFRSNILELAKIEHRVYSTAAKEIIDTYKLSTFCTSDDVESGSHILNDVLRKKNVKVINKSHGVGRYSPYISCDEFYLYGIGQRDFYKRNNRDISYVLYEFPKKYEKCLAGKRCIFVSQATNLNLDYQKYEQDLIGDLGRVMESVGFELYVKVHPNLRNRTQRFGGYRITDELSSRENMGSLIVTVFSTAYYNFKQYGHTVLLNSSLSFLFEGERVVDMHDLPLYTKGLRVITES